MAITSSQTNAIERGKMASGKYLDSAASPAAPSITLGFTPRYFSYLNLTTRVQYEWYEGMASTHTLKSVAAGTRTDDTGTAISVSNGVVTLAAPAQNDQLHWYALG